ncbi:hypothetical protein GY45DRAFT_352337 [Cubamyces sp. BRFM 1775]|nr:hypothetical protein GY45DRAFT_352337 [Cubamyces sp. BRFM 1775]
MTPYARTRLAPHHKTACVRNRGVSPVVFALDDKRTPSNPAQHPPTRLRHLISPDRDTLATSRVPPLDIRKKRRKAHKHSREMLGSASPNSVYYIRPKADRPSSGKAHKLVLTTTSLRNVVLANASDVLYYEVVTPRWERHLTRVSRLDVNTRCFDPVAELLNGSPAVSANVSLHGSENHDAVGIGTEGKEEDVKRAVAVRFYGVGELRPVDDFLQTNVDKDWTKRKHVEVLSALLAF